MLALSEGFTIIKQGIGFHSEMKRVIPDFTYGEVSPVHIHGGATDRGLLTEAGLKHAVACVAAMKDVLGDKVGLALDCGPGWTVPDAIRFARARRAVQPDVARGSDHWRLHPLVKRRRLREVTRATSTPIHTGEQIYLRQNFKSLIEGHAVNILGPDPADVGGIAELKWIAEYADLHGILMAPHGTGNGLLGLAALVQMSAALPANFIAFEYPLGDPAWWYDIVEGLPNPIVKNSMIEVWDRPGMGIDLIPAKAKKYLAADDARILRLTWRRSPISPLSNSAAARSPSCRNSPRR